MQSLFQLKNLCFSYENRPLFQGLDLEIRENEFLGILGPNGCGKTTLLKLLAGILRPSEGSVAFLGKDLEQYSAKNLAQHLALLPQETGVDFHFSALEVVLMGRFPYQKYFAWESAEDLQIARQAMEQTDCLQFASQNIQNLSGGERERVLLARALAQRPKVLLLDEPTTHLDLKHQTKTYRLLKDLHEIEKLTLIVVLHDLNFAAQACSRVALLQEGKIVADGLASQVLNEESIEQVYGVRLQAQRSLNSDIPYFFPKF